MPYFSRRRQRMIGLQQQAEANRLKFQASKKGAIAVLMIFAAIGFLSGYLTYAVSLGK